MLKKHRLYIGFQKYVWLLLLLVLFCSLCSCEKQEIEDTTEEETSSTETTECIFDVAPIKASVEIVSEDGAATEMYTSMVSYSNGFTEGDGPLVFMSEKSYLETIVGDIPLVYLDEGSFLRVPEMGKTEATYGDTVSVYNGAYERIADRMTLSEVYEHMTADWSEQEIYLGFSVWFVKDTEPRLHTHNMYYAKACVKVPEEKPIYEPLMDQVEISLSDGTVATPYSEMMWFTRGEDRGAGAMMSMEVSDRLSEIADTLSLIIIDEKSRLHVSAREGVSVLGGRKVDVYDEEFNLLEEDVPFYDVARTISQNWKGRILYLYFAVRFTDDLISDHGHAIQNAYFVRVYSSAVLPIPIEDECKILAADGETWQRMGYWSRYLDVITNSFLLPTITVGCDSEISITMRDGVKIIKGGDRIDVFDRNVNALAENITIEELSKRLSSEWQNMMVYIFIPVTLLDTGLNGEYAQMVSYEYAAKIEPETSNP